MDDTPLVPIYPTLPDSSPFLLYGFSVSVTPDGSVYLFGGFDGQEEYSNDVFLFSAIKNKITLLRCYGEKPTPRAFHSSVIVDGVLIVWGGDSQETLDNSLCLLNLTSHEWIKAPASRQTPKACFQHTMAVVGETLCVFGGRSDYETLANVSEVWTVDLSAALPAWKLLESSSKEEPLPRKNHTCVSYRDQFIIFGGQTRNTSKDTWEDIEDIWSFSVTTRKWKKLECTIPSSFPGMDVSSVIIDGVVYFFGGNFGASNWKGGRFNAFNILTQRWFTLDNLVPDSYDLPMVAGMVGIGSGLLLFDGTGGKSRIRAHMHVLDTEKINDLDSRKAGGRSNSSDAEDAGPTSARGDGTGRAYLESGTYEICNQGGNTQGLGYAHWDKRRVVEELQCRENNHSSTMKWIIEFDEGSKTFTISPLVGDTSQWRREGEPLLGYDGSPHASLPVLAWQTSKSSPKKRWYATRAEGRDEYYIRSVHGDFACTVTNDTDGNSNYLEVTLQNHDQNNPFQKWKLQPL